MSRNKEAKNYITRHNKTNTHHIIGKCCKRWAYVNDVRNKITILISQHRWLNALFNTRQSPIEQLAYLRELYETVLSDTAKQLFDELISLKEREFYDNGLVKKWALKHKNKKNEH
jgi:hypothetical protein